MHLIELQHSPVDLDQFVNLLSFFVFGVLIAKGTNSVIKSISVEVYRQKPESEILESGSGVDLAIIARRQPFNPLLNLDIKFRLAFNN